MNNAAHFYDQFIREQIKSGINDRIYLLYRRLLKIGLQKNEVILEIGCGIGALTYLLAKRVRKGTIEAFDPSPNSIRFAKEKLRRSNVQFFTGDILSYTPHTASSFDKILLFDVLEHIPEESHLQVFTKVEGLLKSSGLLMINLPNPDYILYDRAHQPEVLQEVDQPVFLEKLLPMLTQSNLELLLFESYSVWVKHDYHFLLLRKKGVFSETFLSTERSIGQKVIGRLSRIYRSFRHRYP